MKLTLRARLAAISTIVFGVLVAALSVGSYVILARTMDAELTARLVELTDGLHGYLRFEPDAATVEFDAADDDQATFVHEATRYYQVYDAKDGRLLAQSSGFAPLGLELTPAEVHAYLETPAAFDITTEYGRLRISNDVGTSSGERRYLLQVGISLVPMDQALKHYRDLLVWRVSPALLVAVLAYWWFSALALRPLSQLAASVREIDVTSLDRRLPVRGAHDELDYVATAFNDALARLEQAVADMRQFSAAMAHELRTPLASLRGGIELSLRDRGKSETEQIALASQIEDIDRLTRLVDRILTLARAESGQIRLTMVPLDVGELAATLVDQIEPIAAARSIDLRCERTKAIVNGDAAWLQQMLLNLLDNALKYTNANGVVNVRVSTDGAAARIEVQDTGIGLSPDDTRQVFERFFRADRARSSASEGVGLGLSLVQWIAAQHRGSVTVDSRVGEGSTFTVILPITRHR